MDDATKKMMLTIVTGIAKKAAIVISTTLTAHGVAVTGNSTEYIASGIVLMVTLGYGVWTDYLKAIVFSQLEVLKAKSLAQAAKLQQHDIAPPTVEQIAAKGPETMTPASVVKVTATLCLLLAFGLALAGPAFAQGRRPPLTGNIPADIANAAANRTGGASADDGAALRKKILSDLSKPFQDLADFIGNDAENAIALSTSIPGLQDGHGQQCWIQARNFTAVIRTHPLPLTGQGMTDLEAGRLLTASANQLCGDAHCTQVFTDLKNAAVTIAQAGFGVIGATAVNAAPSLQDICNKIPNIKLVEPLSTVPPAPVITPIGTQAPTSPPQ